MVLAVAAVIGIRPWFGKPAALTHTPSEAPPAMLLGPALLAGLGLLLGLILIPLVEYLINPALSATIIPLIASAKRVLGGKGPQKAEEKSSGDPR